MPRTQPDDRPPVATTVQEAREILNALTGLREALLLSAIGGFVCAAYMVFPAGFAVAWVGLGLVGYVLVTLAWTRHFEREARRRTAPFRNPIDGTLRPDVPPESDADRKRRQRFVRLQLLAHAAAIALIPFVA